MQREGFRSAQPRHKPRRYTTLNARHSSRGAADETLRERVSEEAREKTKAMKQYMYGYYTDWFKYLNQRSSRLEKMTRESRMTAGDNNGISLKLGHYKKETRFLRQRRRKIRLGQFSVLSLLGKGAFGAVFLARQRDTDEVVALKKILKAGITPTLRQRIVREKKVLMAASRSQWLVGLKMSFQDRENLYLAMEYVPGGDLRALLTNVGVLDEDMARFYLAEMVLCVEALHQLGYTHRDLKPDNFMVASNGHLKLGDFGLSKEGLELQYKTLATFRAGGLTMNSLKKGLAFNTRLETYRHTLSDGQVSVVGSPDYMAVEVLRGAKYTFSVDYWSLGVIFYEMCAGLPPFYSPNSMEIFESIMDFKNTLRFPELECEDEDELQPLSQDGWMLVQQLIEEPSLRLGRNGVEAIKKHPYFSDIDWDTLAECEPPFVPDLDGDTDSSYFISGDAADIEDEMRRLSVGVEECSQHDANRLIGFTYKEFE